MTSLVSLDSCFSSFFQSLSSLYSVLGCNSRPALGLTLRIMYSTYYRGLFWSLWPSDGGHESRMALFAFCEGSVRGLRSTHPALISTRLPQALQLHSECTPCPCFYFFTVLFVLSNLLQSGEEKTFSILYHEHLGQQWCVLHLGEKCSLCFSSIKSWGINNKRKWKQKGNERE